MNQAKVRPVECEDGKGESGVDARYRAVNEGAAGRFSGTKRNASPYVLSAMRTSKTTGLYSGPSWFEAKFSDERRKTRVRPQRIDAWIDLERQDTT